MLSEVDKVSSAWIRGYAEVQITIGESNWDIWGSKDGKTAVSLAKDLSSGCRDSFYGDRRYVLSGVRLGWIKDSELTPEGREWLSEVE